MAIFSRRTLQRLINENSAFLTKKQTKTHVEKLNKGDLSAEWEVVLLNVFNKLGKVIHEPILAESKREIDIYFKAENNHKIEFLADINTVSDYFAEWENPVKYLEDKLIKIKIEKKLPGGFGFEIRGNNAEVTFLRKKPKLTIPNKTNFDKEIFDNNFKSFINEILKNPNISREHHIKKPNIDLKINYVLSGHTFSTYPAYEEITSLEDNSLWKSLIRKYKQLKETKFSGNKGIIICDGDCRSIRCNTKSWYSKTSGEVIRHFLRKKPLIDFVLVVYIDQSMSFANKNGITCKIYEGLNFSDDLDDFFTHFENNAENLFPKAERDAMNAMSSIRSAMLFSDSIDVGASFYGGSEMCGDEIKISSRTVIDLLAGKITYDDFPKSYRNFFQRRLIEGKLIDQISIEKKSERDDDWLIFKFGKKDAAISPFEIPDTKE